jgi:hypothetical protein
MKKILFTAIFIVSWVMILNAQEASVEKIRARYADLQKQIADEDIKPIELVFNINRPGVGMQTTSARFYWNNMTSESYEEDESGKAAIKTNRTLAMVDVEYNVAASQFYHIQYLFDDKLNLIFYFNRIASATVTEERMYFSDEKLIKTLNRSFEANNDQSIGKMILEKTETTNFSTGSKASAAEALLHAGKYKKHFEGLFEIENER